MDSKIFEKYESSAQQEASSGQPPFLLELGGGGGGGGGDGVAYGLDVWSINNPVVPPPGQS